MPLQIAQEPLELDNAVAVHFKCGKATLLRRELIEYSSQLKPLWNGTVYVYKLSCPVWPKKACVFRMRKVDGSDGWQAYPDFPRCPTPLDAIKAALRKKWSAELGFEVSE
jgi:hypothetical protein